MRLTGTALVIALVFATPAFGQTKKKPATPKVPKVQLDTRSVEELIKRLGDRDAGRRREACIALEARGWESEPALPALKKLLEDPNEYVRKAARTAVEGIEAKLKDKPKGEEPIPETELERIADPRLRELAVKLDSGDAAEIITAAGRIGDMGSAGAPATWFLCKAMQDKREKVRLAVVDALAKANPALHPHIVTLSVEKNLSIRSHAADAIARLKSDGRGAFPALAAAAATALNGESTELASTFVSSMAAVAPEHPETLRLVLALCKHQNARDDYFSAPIRRTGCQLATTIGEVVGPNDRRRLIETVASLLTVTDPRVVVSAIESLAAFGKDAAAAEPAIRSLRTHPDKSVRDAAERALPLLSGEGTRP